MGEVRFYHLSVRPLEAVVRRLVERELEQGRRVEVRGRDRALMEALDRELWLGPDEGFVPHGMAGGAHDARQPALLTVAGQAAANAPDCLITVDAAPLDPAEAARLDRVAVVFHAAQEGEVAEARAQWRAVTGAGLAAQYWAETPAGGWEMRQERPARPAAD
ncbi:MAG: DNA polymerase III subunit chi [Rubellimicrobium sp.]|nr:DNA polymerase III subunit chi [Rubellimicrobium sp.]